MWRDLDARRAYNREWAKTDKAKEYRRKWRKTAAGRQHRVRAAQARRERNQTLAQQYKITRGCVDCGYNKWPEALDFDHRTRRFKRFNISQKMLLAWKTLEKEIRKCDVRCANCHRHKTLERHPNGFRK